MSGICGVVHWDGAPVGRDLVLRMAHAAAHRSTDGMESEVVENIGFAHLTHRLTPESVYERQPLRSADGNLLLTADVRLDNRDELLYLVESAGEFSQPDPTDADLLLAAYRRWGLDCPRHLLGDFAFALYDRAARRLFAARDAMAMRPFYYRIETNRTLFASEVKQLLAVPGVPAEISEPAVAAHLIGEFGHLGWTFYQGIAQLEPAFALAVDGRGVRTWRYWEVDPGRRIRYRTREDYVQHFRHLFIQAVGARLRSRRPSGIFLSGGMDSGSVASTAAWIAQRGEARDIRAYCWAFDDLPECDEREISDQLVRHFDLPVTYLPAATARPLEDYPAHGPDRDEPFIGVYQPLLEQTLEVAAAEGMGLMLSGDRGDLMVGHWIRDYFPRPIGAGRVNRYSRPRLDTPCNLDGGR